MKKLLLASLFLGLPACAVGVNSSPSSTFNDAGDDAPSDAISEAIPDVAPPPQIRDGGIEAGSFDLGTPETAPIYYQGGPVLTTPINVYFIWYGNWTDIKTRPILEDFMRNIGNSAWWQISTDYYQIGNPPSLDTGMEAGLDAGTEAEADVSDASTEADAPTGPQTFVSNRVNFVESINVSYTHGQELGDEDIPGIVGDSIGADLLPLDIDGVYFVFTSADVSETSGFCWNYCGWHENSFIQGADLKIAYVGDTGSCSTCSLQQEYVAAGFQNSPNGDWSADSMVSVVAHELAESASDPDPNTNVAWMDYFGYEDSDKCAWTYGQPYVTLNHSVANVSIGTRDFMIQQEWILDNDGGACGLHR